jgi:hypothetical protein
MGAPCDRGSVDRGGLSVDTSACATETVSHGGL